MSSLCSDKRDILDLVKLSYIIVRTGIGTGQIQVAQKFLFEKLTLLPLGTPFDKNVCFFL